MAIETRLAAEASKCLAKHRKHKYESAFYNLRKILGNANWAEFFCIIGPRQNGKTYAVIDYYVSDFVKTGTPFY